MSRNHLPEELRARYAALKHVALEMTEIVPVDLKVFAIWCPTLPWVCPVTVSRQRVRPLQRSELLTLTGRVESHG